MVNLVIKMSCKILGKKLATFGTQMCCLSYTPDSYNSFHPQEYDQLGDIIGNVVQQHLDCYRLAIPVGLMGSKGCFFS